MNRPRILVIGATGRIGGEVIRLLDKTRIDVRAIVRKPTAIQSLPDGIEAAVGDLSDKAKLTSILDGVKRVFVAIRDCPEQVELEGTLIDAARTAGVERFVKISAFAAGLSQPPGYGRVHSEIEKQLKASGMTWTILQPHAYMQNFLDIAPLIRRFGVIPFPLGRGRVAFIDARDVALVAKSILSGEDNGDETLQLTGPQALSLNQCADILSETLDRRVRSLAVPQWLANIMMRREGVSRWDIRMRAELFSMLRENGEAATTDTVMQIKGKPGRTFKEFATDHRDRFA